LKGVDNGIMDEPAVSVFVEGSREVVTAAQWPPKEIGYRPLYLRPRHRLSPEPELMGAEHAAPDGFYQAPLTVTDKVEIVSWSTPPFEEPAELIGTGAAHLFVAIDQDDTNLIMRLWDAAPDGSRQLLTTGFLKASHRELDERTTEGNPYHPHTRAVPVEPGEIEEYVLRLYPFAATLNPGHRLVAELSNPVPPGAALHQARLARQVGLDGPGRPGEGADQGRQAVPVVAAAGHRHRQPGEGRPVGVPERDADRDHAALRAALVDDEAVAPHPGQLGPELFQVGAVLRAAGVPLGRVDRLQLLVGQLGEQEQARGGAVGGEHHALAGAHPQVLEALGAGDEPDLVAGPHRQVDGLVQHAHQPVHVRQRSRPQPGGGRRRVGGELQDRPRPVDAPVVLDREVAVDEHREEAVGGGAGHAQPLGYLGDGQLAFELEHGGDPQGVIDAVDQVGRRVLQRLVHDPFPFCTAELSVLHSVTVDILTV